MDIQDNLTVNTKFGGLFQNKRYLIIAEILLVFLSAFVSIKIMGQIVGNDPLSQQMNIWTAYIIMLISVWIGLKLHGETLQDFGLTFKSISLKEALKVFGLSLIVFVLAISGFIIGSIIMANITGIPENADMSGYAYLKDNIGMLLLTLFGVYIVSSFGEEVIFRAFLINRITQFSLNTKTGKIIAVILSSVIFGLVHYEWGAMGMVQTGFMGLALGLCYIFMKKRLWILILAHAYMDTILMVQMYFASN